MGKQYAKSFLAKGDSESVFNASQKYLLARGFAIRSAQKPSSIIAERGSKLGSFVSVHVEKIHQTLVLSLRPVGEDIEVVCNYDLYAPTTMLTSGDKMYLDSEIEMLKSSITSSR